MKKLRILIILCACAALFSCSEEQFNQPTKEVPEATFGTADDDEEYGSSPGAELKN